MQHKIWKIGFCSVLLLISFYTANAFAFSTRIPITIANPTGSTLTNHTIRLELNASNVPGFDWSNNGDDIFVSDSGTLFNPIDYFLESFDSVAQTAVVWVEVPSVPASPPDTMIYLYYDDATASSLSSAPDTFTVNGFKYHTQFYNDAAPGPESRAEGEAVFDFDTVAAAGSGYGCTALGSIEVDNSGTFGSNNDIAFFHETMFEVPVGATYEFRMGMDFGDGGELYVDGITVEADWSDDLWWANSYTNADTLTGSIPLTAGFHTLQALGFERCCDGPSGIQFRTSPTGPWVDFEVGTPGLTLYAPDCPATNVTFGMPETVPVTLSEFSSQKIGPYLKLSWHTADETFNVGFNLWAKLDGRWEQINRVLVRSHFVDSSDQQEYSYTVNLNKLKSQPRYLALSSVEVTSKQAFHGPFEIGESYGQAYANQPIDWPAVQQANDERMAQLGYYKLNNRWRRVKQKKASQNNAVVAVEVEQQGVYRVSHQDLLAAGVDWSGVHKQHIAVAYQQKSVPRWVGGNRYFGKNSYIEFVGLPPKGGDQLYQKTAVFTLSVNPQKALRSPKVKRKPAKPVDWHLKSLVFNDKKTYMVQSPSKDPWQLDLLVASQAPKSKSYNAYISDNVISEQSAYLTLLLNGISDLPAQDVDGDGIVDDEHHALIYLNGKLLHESRFDGNVSHLVNLTFDAQLLKKGDNNIELQLSGQTGYLFDFISVESIKLDYPITSLANSVNVIHTTSSDDISDGFSFVAQNSRQVRAYAYQNDFNLVRLRPAKQASNIWAVPKVQGVDVNYWVSSISELLRPNALWVLPEPTPPLFSSPAELLIISHPSFIDSNLRAYSTERTNKGITNHIISTEDIAQKYGVDVPLNAAIKQFLDDAQTVGYKSVLLVGGHSYDYKNYLQKTSVNFIPTFYHSVGLARFSPTDVPFVDFNNDGTPEKNIGRWPVRTQANLITIINKSVQWSKRLSTRIDDGLDILLLADRSTNLNFPQTLDRQLEAINGLLSVDKADKVYADAVINNSANPVSVDYQVMRNEVINKVTNGLDWLIYNGHGSIFTWSQQGLLNVNAINLMKNSERPVLITSMACYTTYYESPSHQSLAHQLLFSENRGAVAVHGPMMLGEYFAQLNLADRITQLTKPGSAIGETIRLAKSNLPENFKNTAYNWALLGDPTLKVQ